MVKNMFDLFDSCVYSAKALYSGTHSLTFMCPRQESNLHYKLRKLASYPLNDEGISTTLPIFVAPDKQKDGYQKVGNCHVPLRQMSVVPGTGKHTLIQEKPPETSTCALRVAHEVLTVSS